MKKILSIFALSLLLMAWGCEGGGDDVVSPDDEKTEQPDNGKDDNPDDGTEDNTPIEEAVFEIDSDGNYVVEAEGGTIKVKVSTNLEYSVHIPEDAKMWLSVADTRAIRNETLTFTIAKNEMAKERQAAVKIKAPDGTLLQNIVFKQKYNEDDESTGGPISVSKGKVSFDFEGGECELTVNAEYSWVATCSVDWITLQTPDGIAGKEPLKFTVKRNTALSERKATITLKNENYNLIQEVYVIQTEFAPVIEVVESVPLDFTACEKFIEVTSNVEYDVTDDADWLTCEVIEGGINLSATANGTLETRSAQVTISAKENAEALSKQISIVQATCGTQYAIYYTSSSGDLILPSASAFGANIVGNHYKDNQGILLFDAPVTSIGVEAFYNRLSLTSVTIPDSVTSIGERAFSGCTSLTNITIPESVTSIGERAFYDCTSLTNVDYKGNLSAWCKISFNNTSAHPLYYGAKLHFNGNELTDITIPSDITEIKDCAFYNCTSLTSVTIPDSVTSIGDDAFNGCTSLTSITIGNGVTTIGNYAFSGCTGELIINCNIPNNGYGIFSRSKFSKATIGDNVEKIGENAFYNCTSLQSMTLGNSVTEIGDDAFNGCSSLKSITIPENVTTIGWSVFFGCPLTSVYCKPTTPPTLYDITFGEARKTMTIYVPYASVYAYKSASYWSEYASRISVHDF